MDEEKVIVLQPRRAAKVASFAIIVLFCGVYFGLLYGFGVKALWGLPVLLLFALIMISSNSEKTITFTGDKINIKQMFYNRTTNLNALLNFSFLYYADDNGNVFHAFAINTMPLEFRIESPIPLNECLEAAKAMVLEAQKHKSKRWSETVSTKGYTMAFDEESATINGVKIRNFNYRISGKEAVDVEDRVYAVDLTPIMMDFYLFKAYFNKQVQIKIGS